jgi:hypothetical protein
MSLITESRYQELMREAQLLIKEIKNEGASLGESTLVVYEEEFARENEISTLGRVTLTNQGLEYCAGPLHVDRDCPYEADGRNFLDYSRAWTDGKKMPVDVKKWVSSPQDPKFPDIGKEKAQAYDYEMALFSHMRRQGLDVTVVNPSMKTLNALLRVGGYATFSAQKTDERWYKEVRDFCNQSRDRVVLLPEQTIRGHAYLGTGAPKWIPPHDPWVYFAMNPYSRSRFYGAHEFHERPGFVEFVSHRAGREVLSVLLDNPPFFYQNPQTVDYHLGFKEEVYPYFLACRVPYFDVDLTTSHVPHTPLFLKDLPPYEMVQGLEMSYQGREVFDVKANGTYFSRRSMIPLPDGFYWSPYVAHGPYMVTRYSTFPLEVPDVKYAHGHIVFGYETVVLDRAPLKVLDLIVDSAEVPFGSTHRLGTIMDTPMYRFVGTKDEERRLREMGVWYNGVTQAKILDDVLVTDAGIYLRDSLSSFSGFAVQPKRGRQIACNMRLGEVYKLKVYYDGVISYVTLPPELHANSWIFSTHESVQKYLPQIFLFSKMWVNSNDVFRVDDLSVHQVAVRKTSEMISDYMRTVNKASVVEVQSATGIGLPLDSLFSLLSRVQGLYWWEGTNMSRAEFVNEIFLSQRIFPASEGIPPTLFTIDGKSYLDSLNHLHRRGHAVFYSRSSASIRRFCTFLRGNPYTVQFLRRYPQYFELSVKAYRW